MLCGDQEIWLTLALANVQTSAPVSELTMLTPVSEWTHARSLPQGLYVDTTASGSHAKLGSAAIANGVSALTFLSSAEPFRRTTSCRLGGAAPPSRGVIGRPPPSRGVLAIALWQLLSAAPRSPFDLLARAMSDATGRRRCHLPDARSTRLAGDR